MTRGSVTRVNGSKDFIVLDYDAVKKGTIKASRVFRDAHLDTPHSEFCKEIHTGEQEYSAVTFPEKGAFLVVGKHRKGRFATFRGADLGWKVGTKFPFDRQVDIAFKVPSYCG